MLTRLFAVLPHSTLSATVKHFHGLPPEVSGGLDKRLELGPPKLLVVEQNADGVFLYRYDAHGEFVGDTWHMTVSDAQKQAEYEYDGVALDWSEVPPNVGDVTAVALARMNAENS